MTTIEIPDYTKWPAGEMIFELAAISGRLFNEDPDELDQLNAQFYAIMNVAEARGYTMKWSRTHCIQMFTWVEDGQTIDLTEVEL